MKSGYCGCYFYEFVMLFDFDIVELFFDSCGLIFVIYVDVYIFSLGFCVEFMICKVWFLLFYLMWIVVGCLYRLYYFVLWV